MSPPAISAHIFGTTEATGETKDCPCNLEGYIIDVAKKHSDYSNKDLPVSVDAHWSCSFIPTAMLWCSVQCDIWSIAKDELAAALQVIFNMVYPGVKYRVMTASSVFTVVCTHHIITKIEGKADGYRRCNN